MSNRKSIRNIRAEGMRYAIVDTESGHIASVVKTLREADDFPFKPREWAIMDIERGIAWNYVTTWNYIPEEWDFEE